MGHRFSYVKYDDHAVNTQNQFKQACESLERMVDTFKDGRAKSLALTKLEEFYMWVGKAIRDEQIERTGKIDEQPERKNG